MRFKFLAIVFFVVVVAANLAGCGTVVPVQSAGEGEKGTEAVSRLVMARAQLRWNALIKRDLDTAYAFISPGARSLMAVEDYRPRVNPAYWRGAKVSEAKCAAEICDVTVLVDLLIERVKVTSPIKETWILDAGQWWFVYQG